jgi:hypothetical protein
VKPRENVGLTRQFRFTTFEQHVLAKAVMVRIQQVQGDPNHNGYERYKLQQLLERLTGGNPQPRPGGHERGPQHEPHEQADQDGPEHGTTPTQGEPPA